MSEVIYQKEKELNDVIKSEVIKITADLISSNYGKTTYELRKATLDFINQNKLNEKVSLSIKQNIDRFIQTIKIPTLNE